jgi:hypothetical protein
VDDAPSELRTIRLYEPAARVGSVAVSVTLLQLEVTVNSVVLSSTVGLTVPDGQNPDPATVIWPEPKVTLVMVTGTVTAKVGTAKHSNSPNSEAMRFTSVSPLKLCVNPRTVTRGLSNPAGNHCFHVRCKTLRP